MNEKIYIARQPILDQQQSVMGYELLFRSANSTTAIIKDATQATAQVIVNAMNSIGIQKIVGDALAFINCDRNMLLEGALHALDPQTFVFEILEDVEVDDAVLLAVAKLKAAGYKIALDDFVVSSEHLAKFHKLIPYSDFVKLDLTLNSSEQLSSAAQIFAPYSTQLLAEKVEYLTDFDNTKSWGFTLFQGYFFAKPEIMEGSSIAPHSAGILRLIELIQSDPDFEILTEAFKQQPEITFNLLKFINSVGVGMRNEVSSIRQALTLVGQQKLQQWLMIMAFAHNTTSLRNALFLNASQRARQMELFANLIAEKSQLADSAFLTGMLSLMDALYKMELSHIIEDIAVEPVVADALLHRAGVLGALLCVCEELEQNHFSAATEIAASLSISPEQIQSIQLAVWEWIQEIIRIAE